MSHNGARIIHHYCYLGNRTAPGTTCSYVRNLTASQNSLPTVDKGMCMDKLLCKCGCGLLHVFTHKDIFWGQIWIYVWQKNPPSGRVTSRSTIYNWQATLGEYISCLLCVGLRKRLWMYVYEQSINHISLSHPLCRTHCVQCTRAVRRLLEVGWLRMKERAFGCEVSEKFICTSHEYPENIIAHLRTWKVWWHWSSTLMIILFWMSRRNSTVEITQASQFKFQKLTENVGQPRPPQMPASNGPAVYK